MSEVKFTKTVKENGVIEFQIGETRDQSKFYKNGKCDHKLFMQSPKDWVHPEWLPVKNYEFRENEHGFPSFGYMKPNDPNVYPQTEEDLQYNYGSFDETIAAGWLVD
jgi:hypothetical protein